MDAYKNLRWKLANSPNRRICFDEDIEVGYIDDRGNSQIGYASGIWLTERGQIITNGNRCPQIDVTDEETLQRFLDAPVWEPKED